jgi:hypothetical protein
MPLGIRQHQSERDVSNRLGDLSRKPTVTAQRIRLLQDQLSQMLLQHGLAKSLYSRPTMHQRAALPLCIRLRGPRSLQSQTIAAALQLRSRQLSMGSPQWFVLRV